MKDRYRLFKRRGRIFYCFDNLTNRYASLETKDREAARRIVEAKNQALRAPALSRQIGKAYLAAGDPKIITRTWQQALDVLIETKEGPTRKRWERAAGQKALDPILCHREQNDVVFALVVSLVLMMNHILFQAVPQRALSKQDQLGQTLLFDRSDPALTNGIQIRAPRR